jgi:hypothetical protein
MQVCKNCMVLWTQADIADKDGKKLDLTSGMYSHHILGWDYGRKMVSPPIVSRCADGRRGGFNFDLVGMKGANGMGHSHGGPGKGMKKRQAPDLGKLISMWISTMD